MKTKIALIQQKATLDIVANRNQGLKNALAAIEQGAKIICFAELAFQPFYPQLPAAKQESSEPESIPGPTTEMFSQLAKEHQVVFVLNLFEKSDSKTYDSSPVIGTDGQFMGVTRMIHITDYPCFHEKDYYDPGDTGAPVYETEFGKIGVAICYDRHYPEFMRAMAVAGADIVFVPQAGAVDEWPEGLYEAELRVAAFQNGYFTALCNRVGQEPEITFAGESFVCNPGGEVIARADQLTDEILFCEVDLDEVKSSHAKRLFMRDRRPELYASWLS